VTGDPLPPLEAYLVGGAVRDELLGRPVEDRDFVVVGATVEDMLRRGFRPVGADFPVFLHPETHDEYALARTERKSGRGYQGFTIHASPEVTLEQDLARRDLTINAIAKAADGTIVDPYGGVRDLAARCLRHVSPAFVEDPVRLLRVARFAARFGFDVAPETVHLLREMVVHGEIDALVPERVWQELARGLMETMPLRMLDELERIDALSHLMPEWRHVDHAAARAGLARAADAGLALPSRFALLLAGATADAVRRASAHLRVPNDCADLALLVAMHGDAVRGADRASIASLVDLLQSADAWRRPARFTTLLATMAALDPTAAPAIDRIERARAAAGSVDTRAIAQAHRGGEAVAIRAARVRAVESLDEKQKD